MAEYLVLIPCRNGDERYEPGDVVTDGDFPKRVIKNWLEIEPPVLMENPAGDAQDDEEE